MIFKEIAEKIADDFVFAARLADISLSRSDIEITILSAPHRPPSSLPVGKIGVYVFMYGNRCLKVGRAGPNSNARFCGQHYNASAPSTLAKSILNHQSSIGVSELSLSNVKEWICQSTTRINFLLDSKHGVFALSFFEIFVQCRLKPEFEGFISQR